MQPEWDGRYAENMNRGDGEVLTSTPITWWVIIGVGLINLVCHPRVTPPWPLSKCGVQKMGCSWRGGETAFYSQGAVIGWCVCYNRGASVQKEQSE